nr:MAG TPA: hypothetical protein [Bacteriophage sp.]
MYDENKISHNSHFPCVIFDIRRNPKNNIIKKDVYLVAEVSVFLLCARESAV